MICVPRPRALNRSIRSVLSIVAYGNQRHSYSPANELQARWRTIVTAASDRAPRLGSPVAKVTVQFTCTECGTTSGRWLGRCPGCAAFGTLVEELHGSDTAIPARALAPVALGEVSADEAERIATGISELDRVLGGGLVPASLVLVGGEPGSASRRSSSARSARSRAAVGAPCWSPARNPSRRSPSGDPARRRGIGRDPRGDRARCGVRNARGGAAGRLCDRLGADAACLRARIGAGIGRPGERGGRAASPGCEGGVCRHDPRRARDEGRCRRRTSRPRAPRRLRPSVRRRPLSGASGPAGDEEPLRIHERARRLRDDGWRPRRRSGSVGALRLHASRRDRSCCELRARGTRPILLEIQALVTPTDLAMPRRVGTGSTRGASP